MYRSPETHPRVNAAELAYIQSEPIEPQRRVRWLHLLPHRQTWAFAAGKFLTDPIWWFYLFWSGKFVSDTFNVSISKIGLPLIIIYVLADFGSVAGGWLSSAMLKAGFRPNVARKLAMLVCACFILPVIYAPITSNLWVAVTLIGVAAAAHQGFSANIFTTTSDMFPKWSVASVVGFGGMAGAMGGVLMQLASGRIHDATGSYLIMFIIAGTVYFLAILLFHLLAPRMDSVHLQTEAPLNVGLCASLAVLGALVGAAIAVPLTYLFQADFTTFAGYPSHALTALGHVFSKGEHQVMGRTVLSAVLCLAIFGAVAGATVGALLNAKRTQSASPAQ
jgi:ACS family hexuronate transporter-like MFS transporter